MISIDGISKAFQEGDRQRPVISRLDFSLASGERAVLLGRSGSGKSTLLNLLAGIDLPDSGTVTIAHQCINEMNERERTRFRRRHIGFVYQFFNLIPTLSVVENILLPLELNGWSSQDASSRARDLLQRVGLDDRGESFPDTLSGGEQQRVALARAVAHKPALLLADEPTGNLDDETAERILSLLDSLMQQEHTTLLMVTHSDEAAQRIGGRRYHLHQGQLTDAVTEEA